MRRTKFAVLTAVLALTVLLSASCTTYNNFKDAFFSEKGAEADTIKIGVLEPQTGNDSDKGELEIRGIKLAQKLAPTVLGKEVELVYADTQSSIYVAETAAHNLLEKKPAVVLGSYGDAVSLTASQILNEAGIPAIGITCTNPLITANNEYYFRVSFSDASQGRALADYAFDQLKADKAGVVRIQGDDTANEMINQFSSRLRRLTEDEDCISVTVEIPENNKDPESYIKELKESGVKTAFMPMSISSGKDVLAAADAEKLYDVTFLVPKDWHGEELVGLQAKYPGIRIAVASDFSGSVDEAVKTAKTAETSKADETAEAAEAAETSEAGKTTGLYESFKEAYRKEYGKEEPPEAVALAFDAYMIALNAIEKAGAVDGVSVREALLATSGFTGASGSISFNENGEPKKTINIDVIQDGKFVSIFTVD